MKVKAIKKGFYGGIIRLPGVEFSIEDKSQLGSWMEIVKKKRASKSVKIEAEVESKQKTEE